MPLKVREVFMAKPALGIRRISHVQLNEAGVAVEYKMLRAYVSVLHREQAGRSAPALEPTPRSVRVSEPVSVAPPSVLPISRPNPLATAMEYLGKVRGFQNFTGAPPDPDKIF
jgi:hypothetical protein